MFTEQLAAAGSWALMCAALSPLLSGRPPLISLVAASVLWVTVALPLQLRLDGVSGARPIVWSVSGWCSGLCVGALVLWIAPERDLLDLLAVFVAAGVFGLVYGFALATAQFPSCPIRHRILVACLVAVGHTVACYAAVCIYVVAGNAAPKAVTGLVNDRAAVALGWGASGVILGLLSGTVTRVARLRLCGWGERRAVRTSG